jgi:hypothetical protein
MSANNKNQAATLLIAILPCSCAMVGSVEHYEAKTQNATSPYATIEDVDSLFFRSGLGTVIGGKPKALVVRRLDHKFSLRGRSISWDQDWIGPLLPILPVPMGASTRQPLVELELHLLKGSLELSLSDVSVAASGSTDLLEPQRWCVSNKASANPRELYLYPDAPLAVRSGDYVWLEYGLRTLATQQFEVEINPILTGVVETSGPRFPFVRTHARFFAWGLPFGGD